MNLTSDIMGDWSIRDDFCMDDLNTVVKVEDLSAIDPYPFYPILDGAGDLCTGKPGDGCDVCGSAESHLGGQLGMLPCPAQLPLLEWSDVEDQLGEPEKDEMRCVNINQIFNMAEKASPQDKVIVEHRDKVISDCMWSSSSAHRLDMSDLGTPPLPALSVDMGDMDFGRPDTPQTDSESHSTDSDDLIQHVPKEESLARRLSPVPEKPAVTSGRSLLKRNQFSVKVARAPLRPDSKPALPSPTGDSSYSGDHSYSATNCIGILTPSPSPSESSSGEFMLNSSLFNRVYGSRHPFRAWCTVSERAIRGLSLGVGAGGDACRAGGGRPAAQLRVNPCPVAAAPVAGGCARRPAGRPRLTLAAVSTNGGRPVAGAAPSFGGNRPARGMPAGAETGLALRASRASRAARRRPFKPRCGRRPGRVASGGTGAPPLGRARAGIARLWWR